MTALMSASWPMLKRMKLHYAVVGRAAIAAIAKAKSCARLTELSICYSKLDSACTHSLTLMHQRLRSLYMEATGMDAAAMIQLFSMPWPQLQNLVLAGNTLAPTTVEELVSVSMPNLRALSIRDSHLRAAAVHYLARGNWPYLRSLGLCNNHLNNAAMAELAKGRWPRLERLAMSGSRTSDYGLELLMTGPWPQLDLLELDSTLVSKRTWGLLSLASSMPDQANGYSTFAAERSVGHNTVHRVWPTLTQVFFVPINSMMGSVKLDSKSPARKPWLKLVSFGACLAVFVMGHNSSER